jgi:branched-chain amino acid transport system ATP-binding protein
VFAIVGPNGAGKTSILRAISGLLRPVGGDIRFGGSSLVRSDAVSIVRRGISQVPEGRRIFPEMSVVDNLLVGASTHVRNRARVRELLDRSFELFPDLRDRRRQAGGTLSGGEQQQLAIARGLMSDPRLLILDEPTLGLAPIVIHTVADSFAKLIQLGLTVLVAEQNAEFAFAVATAGLILASGEVTLSGDIPTLRETEEVRRAYLGA